MEAHDFIIETTLNTADILKTCNLIVTTTPATSPLLNVGDLQTGTHITAIGSDTPHKQELDSAILNRADVVIADSISQCLVRGEIHKAVQSGQIRRDDVVELGNIISGKTSGRTSDNQITVTDLTGVAVQDIKIATAVYEASI
jgi:ornithine cyclodeaminase